MNPNRPILLCTGFEPFGGHDANPSALLAERLDGVEAGGARVVGARLPVEYDRCADRLHALVAAHRPVAVVAFGLAFTADRVLIERVALNLDDCDRPDNAGTVRRARPIAADGPVAYWSGLPVDRLLDRLAEAGIPAASSRDAGAYVCNNLFFNARHRAATRGEELPVGFVHLPPLPEQVAHLPGRTGLPLDRIEAAGRLIAETVAAAALERLTRS